MILREVWFAVLFTVAASDVVDPISYLWPLPQSVKCDSDTIYTIDYDFTFQGSGAGGELPTLTSAFERYRKFVSPTTLQASGNVTSLETLIVDVLSADESLGLDTDESCECSVYHVTASVFLHITLGYRYY